MHARAAQRHLAIERIDAISAPCIRWLPGFRRSVRVNAQSFPSSASQFTRKVVVPKLRLRSFRLIACAHVP